MPTSLLHTYLFWIPCVQWDLMKCSQEWKHRLVLSSSLHQVLQSIRISEMHNTDLFCWIALATGIAKIEALLCWFQMEGECRWKETRLMFIFWFGVCNKEYGDVEAEKNNNKQSHTIQVSITLHWQAWRYDYIRIKTQKQRGQRKLLMLLSIQCS